MQKILMMVDNGVEDTEFVYPYYRLQEAGYKVDVLASRAKELYTGKHGVPFRSDLSPKDVDIDKYAAVIIPGGRAPDRMRLEKGLVEIVGEAHKKGKVIAAICHGPQMLIEADIVRGKKATCWKSVATDLKNAGAKFRDAAVVIDGNIVTSRFPPDLPKFCKATIRLLKSKGAHF
ncbi:DJ-1/PfpI/YhbO family deglycase/protease [Candidatus Bathyarchaeota archaeon]|nr:DJ-1/PfpI/YhbO family deglycase/protease [Candidatus Bathyarchaeota archaeon]